MGNHSWASGRQLREKANTIGAFAGLQRDYASHAIGCCSWAQLASPRRIGVTDGFWIDNTVDGRYRKHKLVLRHV